MTGYLSLAGHFFKYLISRRAWWMIPVLILLAVLLVLVVVMESPLAPALYPLI